MAWNGTLNDFQDGVSFTGAANSDTSPDFHLLGGRYSLAIYSSGTASVTLNVKIIDGSGTAHYVACGTATTTADLYDLAPGTYQLVFGASAGTAAGALGRVPFRAG